jgi:2-dehydro-3-deoxygluconokinase
MPASVQCFGELLLRLTAPGRERLLQSARLDTCFGGAEANVAGSLTFLGHDCGVISTLPDNALARACVAELRGIGVDTRAIRYQPGRMGLYFLETGALQRPGEILYDRAESAFARAPSSSYDWPALLRGAQWLHLSGITPAVSTAAGESALAAVRAARELGVHVSFDCNYRAKVWGERATEAPAILRELAQYAKLLLGNERDVALILGQSFTGPSAAERFRAATAAAFAAWPALECVAATERVHHSVDHQDLAGLLATRSNLYSSRRYAMHDIVDRIGGGDAFAAGLLHGLIKGTPAGSALEFAVAAAVLKHSIPGDVNRVGVAEVQELLDDASLDVRR